MKKFILSAICASLIFLPLSAENLSSESAVELLRKTDNATSFAGSDFSANYDIVQNKPGQGKTIRSAKMHRRDSIKAYTILITGPAQDKGKGYVQFNNSIWFYDPIDKQFVFTSAKDKFEGTNINNSDFMPQEFEKNYTIISAETVKLGKLDCVKFNLKAKTKDTNYPEIKIWVTEKDGLLRKKEDYSLSGQLLRTTAIPSYQLFKEHSVPNKMLIIDNLRGIKIDDKLQFEKTQITITNVSFEKLKDTVYSKKYVEMMSE